MLRAVFTATAAAAILALSASYAFAEQNSPVGDPKDGHILVRIDNKTGEMSVLNTGKILRNADEAQQIASTGSFTALPKDKVKTARSELDATHPVDTWYFVRHPNWGWGRGWGYGYGYGYGYNYYPYAPLFNYYTTPWNPCWSWNYGAYSYYGYGWNFYNPVYYRGGSTAAYPY